MNTVAILATGASMSQDVANSVRNLPRIVINDAFRLAPDALALVANDQAWWRANFDALHFKGRKFSTIPIRRPMVERVVGSGMTTTTNSGLLGLHVAIAVFGFTRVFLYGFDMQGEHYFGPHKGNGLTNTKPERFEVFKRQFSEYAEIVPEEVVILNATPGSALRCFPAWNTETSNINC